MENTHKVADGELPTIMVTNDDGIDAPGLQSLVQVLLSTNRYRVWVCAPDTDKSGSSHSITQRGPLSARRTQVYGTTAFAISGSPPNCTSLGISKALFPSVPDLVLSGINKSINCGYRIVFSGTVAAAREAFMQGIPSISISYQWMRDTSNINDFTFAAEACLPIISAIFAEIKNKTYNQKCFLNVALPTDILNHKGIKVTKQGISSGIPGWKQVSLNPQGGYISMDMNSVELNGNVINVSQELLLFKREVKRGNTDDGETDFYNLLQGYITVTPLGALSNVDIDCHTYFKDRLPGVVTESTSSDPS
ncbi:uncharacterized protein [Rutidosis leptorrhynchoides]|uniref:uncharacterized protein n=1 Tax=Rutidosis leptorrhynchoides TaxID=125765 RepID=UPI003A99C5C3